MAATKVAPQGERSTLRIVLFVLSIALCLLSFYFMLDFQTSSQAKLSGELILGQVDTVSYNHQGSPIISFFFEYFGVLSYFWALMIVYLGYYLLLRPVDIWHVDFYRASLRVLGFDLSLIGLCALASTYGDFGATGAGGLLGDMLIMFSYSFLPNLIAVIIYVAIAFSGLTFLWGKSPLFVFDSLGATFFKAMPGKNALESDKKTAPQAAQVAADRAAQNQGGAALDPERAALEQAALAQGEDNAQGHLTVAQFEEQLRQQGQLEPAVDPAAEEAAFKQNIAASGLSDPSMVNAQGNRDLMEDAFMRGLAQSVATQEATQPVPADSAAALPDSALPGGGALAGGAALASGVAAGGSFFEQVNSGAVTITPQAELNANAAALNSEQGEAWSAATDTSQMEAQELERSLHRGFSGEATVHDAWGDHPVPESAPAESFGEHQAAVATPMPTMEHTVAEPAKTSFNTAEAYGQGDLSYWQGQGALAEAAFKSSHARNLPDGLVNQQDGLTNPQDGLVNPQEGLVNPQEAMTNASAGLDQAPESYAQPSDNFAQPSDNFVQPAENLTLAPEGVAHAQENVVQSPEGLVNPQEGLDPSLTDPNEVHTKIIRGPDPVALKRQQEAEAVAAAAAAAEAEATAAPEAEPAARPGSELSPYGYGTYAAEQAQDVSAVMPESPSDSGDGVAAESDTVHTIVQRVDPQVFAAEQEARRREREEAARQAEAERQAQAEAERSV